MDSNQNAFADTFLRMFANAQNIIKKVELPPKPAGENQKAFAVDSVATPNRPQSLEQQLLQQTAAVETRTEADGENTAVSNGDEEAVSTERESEGDELSTVSKVKQEETTNADEHESDFETQEAIGKVAETITTETVSTADSERSENADEPGTLHVNEQDTSLTRGDGSEMQHAIRSGEEAIGEVAETLAAETVSTADSERSENADEQESLNVNEQDTSLTRAERDCEPQLVTLTGEEAIGKVAETLAPETVSTADSERSENCDKQESLNLSEQEGTLTRGDESETDGRTGEENARLDLSTPAEAQTLPLASKPKPALETCEASSKAAEAEVEVEPTQLVAKAPEAKSKPSEAELFSSAFLKLFEPASKLFEAKRPEPGDAADPKDAPANAKPNESASLFEKISRLTILTARLFESTKKPAEPTDAKSAQNATSQAAVSADPPIAPETQAASSDSNAMQNKPKQADLAALRQNLLNQHVQKAQFSKLHSTQLAKQAAQTAPSDGTNAQPTAPVAPSEPAKKADEGKADPKAKLPERTKKTTQPLAKPSDSMAMPKQAPNLIMQKARAIGSIAEVPESSAEDPLTNSIAPEAGKTREQSEKANVRKFGKPTKANEQTPTASNKTTKLADPTGELKRLHAAPSSQTDAKLTLSTKEAGAKATRKPSEAAASSREPVAKSARPTSQLKANAAQVKKPTQTAQPAGLKGKTKTTNPTLASARTASSQKAVTTDVPASAAEQKLEKDFQSLTATDRDEVLLQTPAAADSSHPSHFESESDLHGAELSESIATCRSPLSHIDESDKLLPMPELHPELLSEHSLQIATTTEFDVPPPRTTVSNGEKMPEHRATDDDIMALIARSRNLTKRTSLSDEQTVEINVNHQPSNEDPEYSADSSTGINFSQQIGNSKSTFSATSCTDTHIGTDTVDFAQISALIASAKSLTNRREPVRDSAVPQYAERSPISSTGDSAFDLPPLSPKNSAHEYSATSDSYGEASNDATAAVADSEEEPYLESQTTTETVDSDRIAALLASARSLVNRAEPSASPVKVSALGRTMEYSGDRRSSSKPEPEVVHAQNKDDDAIDASKISALIASAQNLVSRADHATPPVEITVKSTEPSLANSSDELHNDDLFSDNDLDAAAEADSVDAPSEQRLQALLASARSYTSGASVSSGRPASTYRPLSREVYGAASAERPRPYESSASRSSVSSMRPEQNSYTSPVAEAASMFRAISMRALFDEEPRRTQQATRYYVPRNLENHRPVDIADRVPQLRGFRDQHRLLCRGVRRHADFDFDVEPPSDYTMRASDEHKAETSFYQSVFSAQAILNTLHSDDRFSNTSSLADGRYSTRLSSASSANRLSGSRHSFKDDTPLLDEVDAYEQVSATSAQSEMLQPRAAESAAPTTTTPGTQSTAKNDNFLDTLNEANAILSLLAKNG